jgi:hypothetical protein
MNDHAVTTTHGSDSPVKHTRDDVARIGALINTAPLPNCPLSTSAALAMLAPVLIKARDRGHTLASLAELCQQQGLRVTERTVGRAITAERESKPAGKKTTAGTRSTN